MTPSGPLQQFALHHNPCKCNVQSDQLQNAPGHLRVVSPLSDSRSKIIENLYLSLALHNNFGNSLDETTSQKSMEDRITVLEVGVQRRMVGVPALLYGLYHTTAFSICSSMLD